MNGPVVTVEPVPVRLRARYGQSWAAVIRDRDGRQCNAIPGTDEERAMTPAEFAAKVAATVGGTFADPPEPDEKPIVDATGGRLFRLPLHTLTAGAS